MHIIAIICITIVLAGAGAVPVFVQDRTMSKTQTHREISRALKGLTQFKRKLQQQGLINSVDDNSIDADYDGLSFDIYAQFDELETLQLIPLIIDQLQKDQIDDEDRHNLKKLFGSLWLLIEEEAKRRYDRRQGVSTESSGDAASNRIDPVLKAILRAQRFSHRKHPNDLQSLPAHGLSAKLASRNKRNGNIEPSQRILKMAALLINEQMQRNKNRAVPKRSARKHANKAAAKHRFQLKQQQQQDEPMATQLVRNRRSSPTFVDDLDDNQLNALNSLIGDEDAEYDEDYSEDAGDDVADVFQLAGLTTDGEVPEEQQPAAAASTDYDDYAFDVTAALAEDDDALLRRMYGAPRKPKNEGSITELFRLATKHRQRKQRNSVRGTATRLGSSEEQPDEDYY